MRIRDKILIKLKRNNDQSIVDLYKKFRNRVTESLRKSKASYFFNYCQRNSSNMKQLWSGIKSVISIRKSSNINVVSLNQMVSLNQILSLLLTSLISTLLQFVTA